MEDEPSLQQLLFQQLKIKTPDNLSFVNEIAGLLGISYDSAYRRIRGEKELSLDEIIKLSTKYQVSLDMIFNLESNNVVFRNHSLELSSQKIKEWLAIIYDDFYRASRAAYKEVYYAAKDPPIFHYFQFPEIAAFKFFFWDKTLFEHPEYEEKRFRLDDMDQATIEMGEKILKAAIEIPTIEIWNEDTFNIFSRQIEYYWISGFFEKKDDMFNLIDKLEKWVRHMQRQADKGFKFLYGQPAEGMENSFVMYENEVVLNDNAIYASVDNMNSVYLTYNVISLMISQDPLFCEDIKLYMQRLIRRSNLISQSGSLARNRFFNKLLLTIDQLKERLEL